MELIFGVPLKYWIAFFLGYVLCDTLITGFFVVLDIRERKKKHFKRSNQ